MASITHTGWFVRCPRWFYNRWPWAGIIHIWDEPTDHIVEANKKVSEPNADVEAPPPLTTQKS